MADYKPFDPLSYANLGASVADALIERDPVPMTAIPPFMGEGVYAIYYLGDFDAYSALTEANKDGKWQVPIYVGKADPPGGRKGGLPDELSGSTSLRNRLMKHGRTIASAQNLNIDHFYCRFLLVNHLWLELAENMMITRFAPIWNTLIDGFGNNDPGSGRYAQLVSRWDVLHPGRSWADRCARRPETSETIAREVADHLRSRPPQMPDLFEGG